MGIDEVFLETDSTQPRTVSPDQIRPIEEGVRRRADVIDRWARQAMQ